jgi:hypothetical protein
MRKTELTICGRKIQGYPQVTFNVKFNNLQDLLDKIDEKIESTDFGKVDVYVDEEEGKFSPGEVNILNKEWIFIK